MAFPGFTPADFKVFDIEGFKPRMEAIKSRIRPKLEAIGRDLLPDVARIAGDEAFAHVAKHMRRTVNPPDDTWVAFALDKRGSAMSSRARATASWCWDARCRPWRPRAGSRATTPAPRARPSSFSRLSTGSDD